MWISWICRLLVLVCAGGVLTAATPQIVRFSHPSEARIMGRPARLSVEATGGGDVRPLRYEWTLLEGATGQEKITSPNSANTSLEIWEASAGSTVGVGQTIQVRLRVFFDQAVEGEDQEVEQIASIYVSGRNRPPVPAVRDLGGFGTPTSRVVPGSAVNLIDETVDPDGDTYTPTWAFGARRNTGSYLNQLVLIGSHGFIASFTVPEMTGPVDQDVVLSVQEGLYLVRKTVTTYLAPASSTPPPSPTNRAPVVSVAQPSVTVVQGQTATLQVTASDADGDALAFSWLLNSVTVQQPAVVSPPEQVTATTWRSTLSYPTASLAVGGPYTFSAKARETSTTQRLESGWGSVSLYVTPQGGTGTGHFQLTPSTCEASNGSPQLVSLTPDPRSSELRYLPGQPVRIEAVFSDTSTRQVGQFTEVGVPVATWSYPQLTQRGVTPVTDLQPGAQPSQSKAILTFNAPSVQPGEARVSVTAQDVLGCPTTLEIGMVFAAPTAGTAPIARIRYQADGVLNQATNGQTITGPASRSLLLDAGASEDDGGLLALNFTWSVSGIAGATVSPTTGTQTTLTVPASATGTASVTLRAVDGQSQQSTSVLNVSYGGSSGAVGVPTAKISYTFVAGSTGSAGTQDAPAQETQQTRNLRLNGGESTDSNGVKSNLEYQWVAWGIDGVRLSSETGQLVDLTVPEGRQGTVHILLVVRDLNVNTKDSERISIVFPEDPGAYPTPGLSYSLDGGTSFSTLTDGQEITGTKREVRFRAEAGDQDSSSVSFQWETSGLEGSTLTRISGRDVVLTLPVGVSGVVHLTLTAKNQHSLSRSVSVKIAAELSTPIARILKAPPVITKGEVFEVQGSGVSGGGSGEFRFVWRMECCDGLSETGAGRVAQLALPDSVDAEDGELLTLSLQVEEDGILSAPVQQDIVVQTPRLQFSQWAAGPLGDSGQRFETAVVLINGSDFPVDGRLVLSAGGSPEAGPPDVTMVDDLGVESGAEAEFSIGPRSAREFTVVSDSLQAGWLQVESSGKLSGQVFYRILEFTGEADELRSEVPILPVDGGEFSAYLPGQSACIGLADCPQVALALVNLSDAPVDVKITLRDLEGFQDIAPPWRLAPGEHRARFLNEIFRPSTVQGFPGGTMEIVTEQGNLPGRVSLTIIRTLNGRPLSIMPVVVK